MTDPLPFYIDRKPTLAGDIRGVILDNIAHRCGQVADVHPRLLDGIESAVRRLAAQPPTDAPEHRRVWLCVCCGDRLASVAKLVTGDAWCATCLYGHHGVMAELSEERGHQINKGWTHAHDDQHDTRRMIDLAIGRLNPSDPDHVRASMLEVAALLVAAVEAIDRRRTRRAEATIPAPVCRECGDGKHRNCDGQAWDTYADAPTECTCPDAAHRPTPAPNGGNQ